MAYLSKWSALLILASSFACAQSAAPPAAARPNDSQTPNPPAAGAVAPQPALPDSKILEVIHEQAPGYPITAMRDGIQGEVIVRVQVSETGDVVKTEVLSGDPNLTDAAVRAAKKVKFKPFIRNGKPVKAATKLPFEFYFDDKVMENHLPYEGMKAVPVNADTASLADASSSQGYASCTGAPAPAQLDAGVTKGALIRQIRPVYPPGAMMNNRGGCVVLQATIGADGHIKHLKPISGPPELFQASVGAVEQWLFEPSLRNGEPVEVDRQVAVNFIPEQRVQLAPGVTSGMLIRKIAPVYPPEARANHIQGTVLLQAIIGKDGRLKSLKPVSGPIELFQASIGAVQQWMYKPYLLNGEPVEVDTKVTVNFILPY